MIVEATASSATFGALLLRFASDDRAATAIEYGLIAAIASLGLLVFADMTSRTPLTPALDVLGKAMSRPPVDGGGHQVH